MADSNGDPKGDARLEPEAKPIEWGNAPGISAPSETAAPFMGDERYVDMPGDTANYDEDGGDGPSFQEDKAPPAAEAPLPTSGNGQRWQSPRKI